MPTVKHRTNFFVSHCLNSRARSWYYFPFFFPFYSWAQLRPRTITSSISSYTCYFFFFYHIQFLGAEALLILNLITKLNKRSSTENGFFIIYKIIVRKSFDNERKSFDNEIIFILIVLFILWHGKKLFFSFSFIFLKRTKENHSRRFLCHNILASSWHGTITRTVEKK